MSHFMTINKWRHRYDASCIASKLGNIAKTNVRNFWKYLQRTNFDKGQHNKVRISCHWFASNSFSILDSHQNTDYCSANVSDVLRHVTHILSHLCTKDCMVVYEICVKSADFYLGSVMSRLQYIATNSVVHSHWSIMEPTSDQM